MDTLKFPTQDQGPPVPSSTPIDVLILNTLAQGGIWDAKDIAKLWAEDERRVREWLGKFVKRGLAVIKVLPDNRIGFHGHKESIEEFLKNRQRPVA